MSTQQVESSECYAKGCVGVAATVCDSCGHRFCSQHMTHISIQRRTEHVHELAGVAAAERVPTHTEIYALCFHCKSKPVPFKPALFLP